jgi:SsrA-binding protein
MGAKTEGRSDDTIVASNRKARHDYAILDTFECGIQLTGSEVKSLRLGQASLVDCYARFRGGELWLEGMHVPAYEQGDTRAHLPMRPRKLLLHRRQMAALEREVMEKSLTLVPLRVYFTHGIAKVELATARGKRQHEKRQSIAKRDAQREAEQALGRRR